MRFPKQGLVHLEVFTYVLSQEMDDMKRNAGPAFLGLGLVFLALGFVQQGFALNFESGFFNMGLMFVLGGIVASALDRRSRRS